MRSSEALRREEWRFLKDVSGQPIGSQNSLIFEDGADRVSRNVGKELTLQAA